MLSYIYNFTKIILSFHIKKITALYLLTIVSICANAQDIALSQFYSNMVFLNPAYVGVHEGNRFNSFYRNQWTTSQSGYQCYGAVYDSYFPKLNGGAGVILSSDVAGTLNLPSVDFAYSYQTSITHNFFISFALQAGVVQRYRNGGEYNFEEYEYIPLGSLNTYPDFAIGTVFFYRYLYGGVSVDHIFNPKHSEVFCLNRKYTAHIGFLKEFDARLIKQQRILSPNLVIQISGVQSLVNWGANFQYNKILGGVWLRHNLNPDFDAVIFSLGFKTNNYKITYSYDMSIGKREFLPMASHELSYTVVWNKKNKGGKKNIKSPTFLQ